MHCAANLSNFASLLSFPGASLCSMIQSYRDHRQMECEHGISVKLKQNSAGAGEPRASRPVTGSWLAIATPWAQIGALFLLVIGIREWALAERQSSAVQSLQRMFQAITISSPRSNPLR